MKQILPHFMLPLIAVGVLAEQLYAIEMAGNLSMFALWLLIVFSFIAVSTADEKFFESNPKNIIKRINGVVLLLVLVASGWFVTATFTFVAWLFLFAKRLEVQKKKAVDEVNADLSQ